MNLGCMDCGEHIRRNCGICVNCYSRQGKAIRSGKITIEELVEQGKRLPPQSDEMRKRKHSCLMFSKL